MNEAALIEVRQLPIIAERLNMVKEQAEAAVAEAESMICTADTIQAVKTRRAELRKQFDALEDQRKAVKNAVLAPYNEFEAVYRECITEPMKRADSALKCKVDDFEGELKKRCEEAAREYFNELATVYNVSDFLTWGAMIRLGNIKISMSDATSKNPKKLREAIRAVVERVDMDLDTIQAMDDAVEITAEYKKCFDVGAAVATVQDRKRRIAAEKEAAEARRAAQDAQNAAAAKVDAVAPPEVLAPAVEAPAPEKLYTITFTIRNVTRAQAVAVREYLKQEGISYE